MHISSIELLEVLLLLRKSGEREWRPADVAREIGSSMMSIRDRLANLAARDLIATREVDDDLWYHYAPESEVRHVVDELARAYKERRLTIIDMIYARQLPGDIETFSDAFLIRKKDGD
ncbi:hypothetical protein [Chondromyces crocatus]|uniref:Transcriptional regulator n=1 Tax=Chondromyces crocatus TaxID=52 RepID=A0A0K1EA49_CHOCO|nr:hypothetical protein [Chondromyces crocatus]AKT37458.1 uncharacterized protein CMC5_015990 [Chondromyces crocatus]